MSVFLIYFYHHIKYSFVSVAKHILDALDDLFLLILQPFIFKGHEKFI